MFLADVIAMGGFLSFHVQLLESNEEQNTIQESRHCRPDAHPEIPPSVLSAPPLSRSQDVSFTKKLQPYVLILIQLSNNSMKRSLALRQLNAIASKALFVTFDGFDIAYAPALV